VCPLKGGGVIPGVKEQVIQMIQTLPDNITLEDVMEELYFKLQVDAGMKELNEGKGISHEEVEKRMSRLKVPGMKG
jgi:predicted transcriptional regulator